MTSGETFRKAGSVDGPALPWSVILGHGLLVGLAWSVIEAFANLPMLLSFRYEQPLRIPLIGLAFHVAGGILVALAWSPLRTRPRRAPVARRRRLHALVTVGTWIACAVLVPYGEFEPPLPARLAPLLGTLILFYLVTLWWRRRERSFSRPALALSAVAVSLILLVHSSPRLVADETRAELPEMRAEPPADAPHVVIVLLDTVRADRMGVAGYHRDTFPVLDRLAAEGVVFERAISPAPWTVPSHASMFTGLYPSAHGAHHESTYLDGRFTTLAEHLYGAGWDTAIFGSNPWVSHTSGLAQGFAEASWSWADTMARSTTVAYRVAAALGRGDHDHGGAQVVRDWTRWLRGRDAEGPFFAYLGFVETHIPYHQIPHARLRDFAPDKERERLVRSSEAVQRRILQGEPIPGPRTFDDLGDVYDAGQHYVNDLVEGALAALERHAERDVLLLVASDHGDLLGEKGMLHHTRSLSERLLAVPLLFHRPETLPAGRRVATPVTTAALAPTVLDLLGLPVPRTQVTSLAPLVRGGGEEFWPSPLLSEQYEDQHEVFGEYEPAHPFDRFDVRWRAYEEDGWKLVVDSEGEQWLFRPEEDPDELVDLADRHPEVVRHLQERLALLVDGYGLGALDRELGSEEKKKPKIDEATREQLEALGYL